MRDDIGASRGVRKMKTTLVLLLKDESAATAIEYAMIAAGIAAAIVGAVIGLGSKLSATYTGVNNAMN